MRFEAKRLVDFAFGLADGNLSFTCARELSWKNYAEKKELLQKYTVRDEFWGLARMTSRLVKHSYSLSKGQTQ